MSSAKITKFGGLLPKNDNADWAAEKCLDVDLSRGFLQPFRTDKKIAENTNQNKSLYTNGCCITASQDSCATFARVHFDCDYLIQADNAGIWVAKWQPERDCLLNFEPLGFDLSLPAPTAQVLGVVAENFNREMRQYFYTVVNSWGWESPPSDVNEVVVADSDKDVIIANLTTELPENVEKIRIYCAVSGLDYGDDKPRDSHFLQIGEIDKGQTVFVHKAQTTYGDTCATENHNPPPRGIHSIAFSENGQIGGIVGKELHLSEPFAPYAFAERYRYGDFRGLPKRFLISGNYGYVLTDECPAVVDMTTINDVRDVQCINEYLPIVSCCSAATFSGGCVYATKNGLVLLSGANAKVITLDLMTAEQWQMWQPETLRGVIFEGWYYGVSDNTAFRFRLPENIFETVDNWHLTNLSIRADNFCAAADGLYFVNDAGVFAFNAGNDYKELFWQTKINKSQGFVAWSAYKLVVDYAPAHVQHIGYKRKMGRLTSDKVILGDKLVGDSRPHRLKAGYAELDFSVSLRTKGAIREYTIATSVAELGEK